MESDVSPGFRWARLGMLQRALEAGFAAPKLALYTARLDARELRKDSAWISTWWKEPAKVEIALAALEQALTDLRRNGATGSGHVFRLYHDTLLDPKVLVTIRPKAVKAKTACATRLEKPKKLRAKRAEGTRATKAKKPGGKDAEG
jgi:hypothetical protein